MVACSTHVPLNKLALRGHHFISADASEQTLAVWDEFYSAFNEGGMPAYA